MEEDNKRNEAVEKLSILLHQKGYRQRFTIAIPRSGLPRKTGTLRQCLDHFLAVSQRGNIPGSLLLETHPPYDPGITCHFRLQYKGESGFHIREVQVIDKDTRAHKYFRLQHNQQLPGSQTLSGLFPRPKPWDGIKKGRFRP